MIGLGIMTKNQFFQSLKKKWEAAVIITILAATFGLYINFFLPHYYRATSEFLLVQKQNPNIDAYTAIKGSEQLAYTLKQVILSPAFFNKILASNFNINSAYFGASAERRIKKWQKTINIETLPNTGILSLEIFHKDKDELQRISQQTAALLINHYNLFLGQTDQIEIISLSEPILSNKFAKPNALLNTFFGLLAGLTMSCVLVITFPNKKISLTQTSKKTVPLNQEKTKKTIPQKKATAPNNLPII